MTSLPLYRINDQIIFEEPIGVAFSLGIVSAVQQSGDTWEYQIDYFSFSSKTKQSTKLKVFREESFIRGALFENRDKMDCDERGTSETLINLEF